VKKTWLNIIIKIILVIIFSIFIFYPNPIKLIEQCITYTNPENLIQPKFKGIDTINAQIDSLLPLEYTREQELKTVERFVYTHIQYRYDWDLWLNADYWPSAEKVWEKGYEDCDGRAVLAASILRSRGFEDVQIVGNTVHVWVKTKQAELMGPDAEKIIEYEDGQATINLPSWRLVIKSFAFSCHIFPYARIILLIFIILAIFMFPIKNYKQWISLCLLSAVGYVLLLDWAKYVVFYDEIIIQIKTIIGILMIFGSILAAVFYRRST